MDLANEDFKKVFKDPSRYSDKFSSEDAEVTYAASDGVLFKIHRNRLSSGSAGFDPPSTATFDEIVNLTEPANTLELLFQFLYPDMIPDLSTTPFADLDLLNEAAEKYQVYAAMDLASLYMRASADSHPLRVFSYALRHGYMNLASDVAPLVLDEPQEVIFDQIPTHHFRSWLVYYSFWTGVAKSALTTHAPTFALDAADLAAVVTKTSASLQSLKNLRAILPSIPSSTIEGWQAKVDDDISNIPMFYELLVTSHITEDDNIDFCPTSPDTAYTSVDGVTFNARVTDTKDFSLLPPSTLENPTSLPEPAQVLRDIFRYLGSCTNPNSLHWEFDHLEEVADAAEKYKIRTAMLICKLGMKNNVSAQPARVLKYGARYHYLDLCDLAAPLCIGHQPSEIGSMLPINMLLGWIRYYDRWSGVVQYAISRKDELEIDDFETELKRNGDVYSYTIKECSGCFELHDITDILCQFSQGPSSLASLGGILDPSAACCDNRRSELMEWKALITHQMNTIPAFSTFMCS